MFRDRSQHSIKQRSLDEVDLKKTKLAFGKHKHPDRIVKKREKQPKQK
jgi:hypothetical protein